MEKNNINSKVGYVSEIEEVVSFLQDMKDNDPKFAKMCEVETFIEKLSNQMREYRVKKGMSQGQVAELAGITRQRVSLIETNSTKVTLGTYIKYLSALNINLLTVMQDYLERNEKDENY